MQNVTSRLIDLTMNTQFEVFLKMARTVIGKNLAPSYVERVNSCAKLVMGARRCSLDNDLLEMLTVLKINAA